MASGKSSYNYSYDPAQKATNSSNNAQSSASNMPNLNVPEVDEEQILASRTYGGKPQQRGLMHTSGGRLTSGYQSPGQKAGLNPAMSQQPVPRTPSSYVPPTPSQRSAMPQSNLYTYQMYGPGSGASTLPPEMRNGTYANQMKARDERIAKMRALQSRIYERNLSSMYPNGDEIMGNGVRPVRTDGGVDTSRPYTNPLDQNVDARNARTEDGSVMVTPPSEDGTLSSWGTAPNDNLKRNIDSQHPDWTEEQKLQAYNDGKKWLRDHGQDDAHLGA